MTKTDWTAEEVRQDIRILCDGLASVEDKVAAMKRLFDFVNAYANRIEADERVVPILWISEADKNYIDSALGGQISFATSVVKTPYFTVPLFTHPPAQPAQEQPGWKVPDRAWPKLELWFFRELTSAQRLALFALYGLPVDEIGENHVNQKRMLRYVIASPTPPKEK
jgi:hypothetical protein